MGFTAKDAKDAKKFKEENRTEIMLCGTEFERSDESTSSIDN